MSTNFERSRAAVGLLCKVAIGALIVLGHSIEARADLVARPQTCNTIGKAYFLTEALMRDAYDLNTAYDIACGGPHLNCGYGEPLRHEIRKLVDITLAASHTLNQWQNACPIEPNDPAVVSELLTAFRQINAQRSLVWDGISSRYGTATPSIIDPVGDAWYGFRITFQAFLRTVKQGIPRPDESGPDIRGPY